MRGATFLLVLAAAPLAGCVENDPLVRPGLWRPTGANAADLALQVANPGDLVRGQGAVTTDGQLAAAALDRLRNDKLKKLPDSNISGLSLTNSGTNNTGQ